MHPVTVFSVRETLYLISEAEMLAIDTKMFAEFEYCSLQQARYQPKEAKVQFVTLIASKPELTEPNKLTWKVVDRSGELRKTKSDHESSQGGIPADVMISFFLPSSQEKQISTSTTAAPPPSRPGTGYSACKSATAKSWPACP